MSRSKGRWVRVIAFLHDALWIVPAIVAAYSVRFNLEWHGSAMVDDLGYLVPTALVSHGICF